jgi:O-antigen/teichoic acid export membrane protein
VLPWLAVAEILIFADIVIGARLVATGEERSNLLLVLLAAATNVAANLWLIPRSGAVGAAQATALAYGVRILGGTLLPATRGIAGQALRAQLPAVLSGAAAFGAAIVLDAHRLLWFIGGIALYPVALYLLGAVRPAEVMRVAEALRRSVPGGGDDLGNPRRDD